MKAIACKVEHGLLGPNKTKENTRQPMFRVKARVSCALSESNGRTVLWRSS